MEGWDLQAVVRGCMDEFIEAPTMADPESFFAPLSAVENDLLLGFPEISDTRAVLDELEILYKPFYPVSSQNILASSSSSSISVPKELKQPEQQQQSKKQQPATYRRLRKNQHKRVVQYVAGEGNGSDLWAWRKYGQKPIKGSPYPRSYYRCSSSKGCSARKQVERSNLDPGIFIVTYTSEHNHTHPTRRNLLAGSRRSKFPAPEKKGSHLSPTTPLMAAIEDDHELVQSTASLKNHEEEQMVQGNEGNSNIISMPDTILDNELFFPSLEDGFFLDQLLDNCPLPWFH
ncbi:probable WRKY transcription factor 27 isoform X2 [Corylus avellana]|uniref:probable WRKY transcription factor 27 isoform X2 n=1 Tax=Corylus avellana TaxID=13451 RepID=UPI00286CEA3E|nr:probable WRKY transcription factor 27 isoform X2 [Corylus avellana]